MSISAAGEIATGHVANETQATVGIGAPAIQAEVDKTDIGHDALGDGHRVVAQEHGVEWRTGTARRKNSSSDAPRWRPWIVVDESLLFNTTFGQCWCQHRECGQFLECRRPWLGVPLSGPPR